MKVTDFVDSNLESFRLECLSALRQSLPWLKKLAEETLGEKIATVKPIGSVTQRAKFTPDSDVDVGFYLTAGATTVDQELSHKLQSKLTDEPIDPFGVVNSVVYR